MKSSSVGVAAWDGWLLSWQQKKKTLNPRDEQSRGCGTQGVCSSPSWPPLQALALGGYQEVKCIAHRVGAVDKLAIYNIIEAGTADGSEKVADLLAFLARASPVSLSIRVSLQATPMAFWRRVAPLVPRLRVLELTVSLAAIAIENVDWLVRTYRHRTYIPPVALTEAGRIRSRLL